MSQIPPDPQATSHGAPEINRRRHKKSRTGCISCKERHIRCDEERPVCVNCITGDRECRYKEVTLSARTLRRLRKAGQEAGGEGTSASEAEGAPSSSPDSSVILNESHDLIANHAKFSMMAKEAQGLNLTHLELVHHYSTKAFDFGGPPEAQKELHAPTTDTSVLFKVAFETPYLLLEMMAFSARQLSIEGPPEKREHYLTEAIKLQTQALSLFNSTPQEPSLATCFPLYAFSSILGCHLLGDTLAFRDRSLDAFLTRFLGYLQIHKGNLAVMESSREFLMQTPLKKVMEWSDEMLQACGTGSDLAMLQELVQQMEDSRDGASRTACIKAIGWLQFVLDVQGTPAIFARRVHMAFGWPVFIDDLFKDLLKQKRAEALIIFAHYGIVLHMCQDMWLVGRSGSYIVRLVAKSLGRQWAPWLSLATEFVSSPPPSPETMQVD